MIHTRIQKPVMEPLFLVGAVVHFSNAFLDIVYCFLLLWFGFLLYKQVVAYFNTVYAVIAMLFTGSSARLRASDESLIYWWEIALTALI